MSRFLIIIYGIIAYCVGLSGLIFFMLCLSSWESLPFHIDAHSPRPIGMAIGVDLSLILAFGLQHSVMARPRFKQMWTTVIPKAAERSSYVLLSGIALVTIALLWQPLPGTVWHLANPAGRSALCVLQYLGWAITVFASFEIDHWKLFGLKQVYLNFYNRSLSPQPLTERFFYKWVRHPIQCGILIALWVSPTMTTTRVLLSTLLTIYIFVGLYLEETDLVISLGQDYKDYQKRVPKILPFWK